MLRFNFWYLLAPLGAIIAAVVGYKRGHHHGKCRISRVLQTAWVDWAVATVFGIGLATLIYLESWHGLCQLFVGQAEGALDELVGLMLCVFAPIAVSVVYTLEIRKLASWCSYLGARPFRCQIVQRRDQHGQMRTIIKASDLAAVLAKADLGLCLRPQSSPQTELVAEKTVVNESPQSMTSNLNIGSDDIQTVMTPEYSETLLRLAECQYTLALMHLSNVRRSIVAAKEPTVVEIEHTPICTAEVTAQPQVAEVKTAELEQNQNPLETVLQQMSAKDQEIILANLQRCPGLEDLIKSRQVTMRVCFTGQGSERRARFSGLSNR